MAALVFTCLSQAPAAVITGFDDIDYWVGTGGNESAMVIQWNDGANPASVVWGYRWDAGDAPSVETMLYDIAGNIAVMPTSGVPSPAPLAGGEDIRLSITLDAYSFGNFLTGISFDQNGLPASEFSQTMRDQSGAGPSGESWFLYDLGAGTAWPTAAVNPANFGMSALGLTDQGWYGWNYIVGYTPEFDLIPATFDTPVSAVPEPSAMLLVCIGGALLFCCKRRYEAERRV